MSIKNINTSSSQKPDGEQTSKEMHMLEEAKKMQHVFLDNMSHELRTPITVILGYAGILYDEIEDPDLKEMAEIILKSSNRLTESLNLLLDQSEVDPAKLQVEFERKNLNDILFETAKVYRPVAEDKKLELLYTSEMEEMYCNINPKMFDKIMTNILNNAFKYTAKGSIKIELKMINKDSEKFVNIEISDTGIGIHEEKQSLIFEAFRQVSEGMNRLYQGTGLGLSVTKKFVEIMNGQIYVSSQLDCGTTFIIQFPNA